MNRRQFIKVFGIGGGILAGGLALPALVAEKWGPDDPETDDPREASFWEEDAGSLPETDRITSDRQMDVAVIGSGITGLSAACALKEIQPDLKVCVIDSHRPCSGASSRNSAHMRGEYNAWDSIYSSQGAGAALEWNKFALRGLEAAVDFIQGNNIDCDIHPEPLIWVGTEKQTGALESTVGRMKEAGIKAILHTGKEFHDKSGTDYYSSGIEDHNNYIMHTGKLMKGFLERVLERGIPVYGHSPVLNVTNTDSNTETNILETPNGSVATKKVLFATNAYTPRIRGLLSSRMVPIVLASIATEPMSPAQRNAAGFAWNHMTEAQLISRTIGHTSDNRIFFRGILGYSSFNSCLWKNLEGAYQKLEREMRERLPWAEGLKVTHKWSGAVGMPYSSTPIAGPLPGKGQYASVGYSGSGMVHGFYHGRLVAYQMAGADHPDLKYLRGPSGWIPPEPHRSIGAKTFFFLAS
ncbi:MAG: FAD-binding oxidoreductase [Deltaproteobacteria bacterium]|nr:MAG: FAD-binding oxidoreductase [Deltaproteobacteria bacterium]